VIQLTRSVRFSLGNADQNPNILQQSKLQGYAGIGSAWDSGWGVFHEMGVSLVGPIDPVLGYLVDIKVIDRAVHRCVVPILAAGFRAARDPAVVFAEAVRELQAGLSNRIVNVVWKQSPFLSMSMNPEHPEHALIRVRFEFAASHRLHVATLSAEENVRHFGKCNHASGHGHNYVFEPAVEIRTGADKGLTASEIERVCDRVILQRFDHKHLNLDTAEFAEGSGLNPSVENIAMVFYGLLKPEIEASGADVRLRSVTVWETDRTCATYPGEAR
jgi:6-pyruvoyltetrahydropterin/6-carboxytetrahydropterin synthase